MKIHHILTLILITSIAHAGVGLELLTEGLKKPVDMAAPKGTKDYLYILEKQGTIRIYDRRNKKLLDQPFIDIRSKVESGKSEQGLLGIAFSPSFHKNKQFFLNYTDKRKHTVISRFTIAGNEITEEIILRFKQDAWNHNAGWIGFGPDNMLYIPTGDGGAGNDPKNRAQDLQSLLGKILRIDVSGTRGYRIPKGNYSDATGIAAKPEILSIGLRNPWRCCWDGNVFYIADVGQNKHEEINAIHINQLAGANFGWRLREASHANPKKSIAGDRPSRNKDPIHEYGRNEGNSITGGFVYRGSIKSLRGQYLFTDYHRPHLWSLTYSSGKAVNITEQHHLLKHNGKTISLVSSFAEDPQKELYLISHLGAIYKLVKK